MDVVNITRNFAYLFAGAALVIGFQTIIGHAYAQPAEDQTTSGIYVTVVLAVISLVNSIFSTYLAQKAKMTGQAPNETDLRQQQQLLALQQKVEGAAGAIANLVDFVGKKVAPEAFNQIAEGTLPYIKAQEVVKKVGEIQSDVKHGEALLNEIETKVK
jgi:hypothetical protein